MKNVSPPESKKRWRRRVCWATGACVLPFVAFLSIGLWAERWGRVERVQKADAIVIFGAGVREDGQATRILYGRTRHAFDLWKRGFASKIVCTGGIGVNPPAEAIVEAQLLENWGVPAHAILRDEQSTSTRENALFAARLVSPHARIIAVSDAFHLWRCQRDCHHAELVVFTSPARAAWNTLPLWRQIFLCTREGALLTRDTLYSLLGAN